MAFTETEASSGSSGGGGDSIEVGTTLLTNKDLGEDYLDRDGLDYNQEEWPLLVDTPGFPSVGAVEGFEFGTLYESNISYPVSAGINRKFSFIDNNGVIFYQCTSGGFIYSEDDAETEIRVETATTSSLNLLVTDSLNFIVAQIGGGAGIIVYDYSTKTEIKTTTAGSLSIVYIEYNDNDNLFRCINSSGNVYITSNPATEDWYFDGQSGYTSSLNSVAKTSEGYIIQKGNGRIGFAETLTEDVIEVINFSSRLVIEKGFSKNSLNGMAISSDSGLNVVFTTQNGGRSFEQKNTVNSGIDYEDIIHIENQTFMVMSIFGSVVYTLNITDDVLTWTSCMVSNSSTTSMLVKTSKEDVIRVETNSLNRYIAKSQKNSNPTFTSTLLEFNGSTTDFYQTKGR